MDELAAEVLDHVAVGTIPVSSVARLARAGEHEGVLIGSSEEQVDPGTREQQVVAASADDGVVALTADEGVVAGAAIQGERDRTGGKRRCVDDVVAGTAIDDQLVGGRRARPPSVVPNQELSQLGNARITCALGTSVSLVDGPT